MVCLASSGMSLRLLPSDTGAVPPAPEAAGLLALPMVLPAPRRGAAGLDTGLVLGKHRIQRLNELAAECFVWDVNLDDNGGQT